MQLREVAAIAGRPGLFRILKPTHTGVIVESLDEKRSREAIGASQRLSILSEISMYTTTADGSEPLGNIFGAIFEKHGAKPLELSAKSDGADLEDFFSDVLPDWDRSRVYLSDIKKLVSWYNLLVKTAPDALQPAKEEATATEEATEQPGGENAKPTKAPKAAQAEQPAQVLPTEGAVEAPVEPQAEAPKKKAAPKKKDA
jgi:hypothetical protein